MTGAGLTARRRTGLCFCTAFRTRRRRVAPQWISAVIHHYLTAGSKEVADLIEEKLAGQATRPTSGFEEREIQFRTLPHAELRAAFAR